MISSDTIDLGKYRIQPLTHSRPPHSTHAWRGRSRRMTTQEDEVSGTIRNTNNLLGVWPQIRLERYIATEPTKPYNDKAFA